MLFGLHWDLSSDWAFTVSILPILMHGLLVTVEATLLGALLSLLLGLAFAALQSARWGALARPSALLVEFIRDTPLLVQLYFLYFVLPRFGVSLPAFLTGTLALGIQYSAYTCEVYRAGIEAVPFGQREAARALNLSRWLTYRDVILPQAVPRILPALGSYMVSLLKDTPVLSAVTILELLSVAKIIGDRTFRYLIPLSLVGALFLLLTLIMVWMIGMLERRLPKEGVPLR